MKINEYSLEAYFDLDKIHKNMSYQKILGILCDMRARTREEIERESRICGNTLRPRVLELLEAGILVIDGEGLTKSGHRAETLTINIRGISNGRYNI